MLPKRRGACHSLQNERALVFFSEALLLPKISPAHEQLRRDQILRAALTCFARQGYHATSMDDLVRESGLSVGAIYSYFPSKEDLFLALSDERANHTLAALDDLQHRPDTARETVDAFFQWLADELLTLARVNVEFMTVATTSERLRDIQERRCQIVRQFLAALLSEARLRGTVRDDIDVHATAELLLALNEGIVLLSVAGLRQVSLDSLKAAYVSLLDAGLARPTRSLFSSLPDPAHPTGDV
jgi:AcrR family transcriptional regulator